MVPPRVEVEEEPVVAEGEELEGEGEAAGEGQGAGEDGGASGGESPSGEGDSSES